MTVSTEVNHNEYTGNGVTTSFPYTFRIFKASDLVVVTNDTSGLLRTLTLNTDYTVTGAGSYSGGYVALKFPLPSGWSIAIDRELSVVQETDLRNQGKFFAETHEGAFDYLTMLIQQCFGWLRLALLKPSFIARYYDAKQNRISNLADPGAAQDAVNNRSMRSYVDAAVSGVIGGFGWFIQFGTGAVYRTFQSKMRDTVSLEDFGAKGNGIDYDDGPIALAIAYVASTGKELTGSGIYRCSTGFSIPSSARYNFDFTGSKFIFDDGVNVAVTIGTPGSNPYRGTVRGLQVEKANFVGSDVGILLQNCVELSLENPVVTNFSKAVAAIPGASSRVAYGTIYNPTFTNHEYGFYANPPASSYVNENTIIGGRFASNVDGRLIDQIYLDNATGQGVQHNRFIGVSIEGYNGSGACGRTAINAVNGANQNIFSFCRTEKYGTGWSSGFSAIFGANTNGNILEDPRIDTTISDVSGLNQWDIRSGGIKRVSHATAVSAAPMLKFIRQQPLNNPDTKFAIDVEDTYSPSGEAGFLKYKSARGAGNVIEITTFYGDVLKITGEGEFLTTIKTPSVETTSTTALNYFNGRIGTVGTKTLTPATGATGLLVFSNTSSNTGGVGAEFITNNVAGRQHISFSNPNGVVGSISTNANATAYNTSSDGTLKFGIRDADDPGEIIDRMQVRQFFWKSDNSYQAYGVIAQEFYEVYPDAVTTGGDDPDAKWSVDYSKPVPLLIKEIQQLRKREKQTDLRIKALEEKLLNQPER